MAYYFVANYDVTNMDMYKEYQKKAGPTIMKYGGRPVVVDHKPNDIEGSASKMLIVLKFDSEDALNQWYNSPEYQEILPLRLDATEGWARGAAQLVLPS